MKESDVCLMNLNIRKRTEEILWIRHSNFADDTNNTLLTDPIEACNIIMTRRTQTLKGGQWRGVEGGQGGRAEDRGTYLSY